MRALFPNLTKRGIFATLALASMALWLNIWLSQDNTAPPKTTTSTLEGLTWKAENTRIWSIQAPQTQTELYAKSIEHNEELSLTTLNNIQANHKRNSEIFFLKANSGSLSHSNDLELTGKVLIQQHSPENYQIKTEKLFVDLAQSTAQTDQAVQLTKPQTTTQAIGLFYSADSQTLKLLSDVKTVHLADE